MDHRQFFRLAATLVADDSFPESIGAVRRNLLDAVLLADNNKEKTARELKAACEKANAVTLSVDEIEESLSDSSKYDKTFDRSESKYRILPDRHLAIAAALKDKNLDHFMGEFANKKDIRAEFGLSLEDVRSVLYRFLYDVMNNNLLDFRKVLDRSLRVLPETSVGQQFTEAERRLINRFLEWEERGKNELVFKASNLGMEYCILSNSEAYGTLSNLGITHKTFYLDTNIIYRALGINGPRRKEIVRTFLKKCAESGQTLAISRFTNSEFRASLEYHARHIQKYSNVNPDLFVEYSAEEDIYNYYYDWKKCNHALGTAAFTAYVLKQYDQMASEFSISTDGRLPYHPEDQDIQETVYHYARSIDQYKRNAPPESLPYDFYIPDKSTYDAENIVLVEACRKDSNRSYSTVDVFLVSADHLLLNWDHGRHNMTPVVMLPSHWLSLMLRFASRTSDDYRSFVSFLNLPRSSEAVSNEQLSAVLEGVGQITSRGELQEEILRRIVDAKMDSILRSRRPSAIVERTKIEAAKLRDAEVEELRSSKEGTERQLAEKSNELSARTVEWSSASQQLKNLSSRVGILQQYYDRIETRRALRRWRRPVWPLAAATVIAVAYCVLQWIGPATDWNIPGWIASQIDGLKSVTVQTLFTTLNYAAPTAVVLASLRVLYARVLSGKAKKDFLRKENLLSGGDQHGVTP